MGDPRGGAVRGRVCLTVEELKKIWNTGSKVDNWRDVRASFPNVPLKLYGPGTDSGTFEFFPSTATVQSGRYKPLSRPLFIYAKRASFGRAEVRAFLGFIVNNQKAIASRARFVPLTARQAKGQRVRYRQALKTVR